MRLVDARLSLALGMTGEVNYCSNKTLGVGRSWSGVMAYHRKSRSLPRFFFTLREFQKNLFPIVSQPIVIDIATCTVDMTSPKSVRHSAA